MIGKRRVIYEGSAKTVYEGTEPGTLVQHFKDDTSAFNGTKKALIAGKGVLNNRISAHLMTKLEGIGIPTHFLRSLNMREQLVRQVEIIPVSIVIRNVAAGTLSRAPRRQGRHRAASSRSSSIISRSPASAKTRWSTSTISSPSTGPTRTRSRK